MNGNKASLLTILIIVIAIVVTILSVTYMSTRHTEEMAKLGYQETTIIGRSNTVWTKNKCDSTRNN